MTKLLLRFVTLGTFLAVLIAASSFTPPAFAMGGGGGGGAGIGAGEMRLDPADQPSSQPRRTRIKSTHKKTTRHSSIRQSGT
jgi:hypothetical protein